MKLATLFLAILIGALSLYLLLKQPSSDRAWIPEQSRMATITHATSSVTIHNVRNWTYDESSVLDAAWTDLKVDPSTITRAWFLVEPFSEFEAVGHTFLSFEFSDGTAVSFSVEARREEGEEYSATKGVFREYELSYQWGLERDFVTRRLVYLNHPLRLYPLELSPEAAQSLFLSLTHETNTLALSPRFYNTLTANCTNVLATIVNRNYPGTLPYNIAWNATGYADRYLMDQGLIAAPNSPEETMAAHDLTPHKADVAAKATSDPKDFSAYLRTLVGT